MTSTFSHLISPGIFHNKKFKKKKITEINLVLGVDGKISALIEWAHHDKHHARGFASLHTIAAQPPKHKMLSISTPI